MRGSFWREFLLAMSAWFGRDNVFEGRDEYAPARGTGRASGVRKGRRAAVKLRRQVQARRRRRGC